MTWDGWTIATVVGLVVAVIWCWHHWLGRGLVPSDLKPMSDRWLQDRELFRDQHP